MVAVGLQRTDPGLAGAVHQIAVRPVEEDTAVAAAGQVEVGLRGRTGELPENGI
jgi:hypothetical protein